LLLILLGLLVITAYASIGRPMWIDEFAHFALGGLPPADAMVTIVATTGASLNQGHTGVYLLVDYWLMQAFGANLFALRLPSILSGVVLLAAAATFIRLKGFKLVWRAVVIIALGANASLMYFTGEARPYMPLVASCLATLTYYQYPLSERRTFTAWAFGVIGILGGSVSHPYYALFGPLIAVYSLWERGYLSRSRDNLPRMIAFLNPWLVLPAVFLFIVVGLLSWAKGRPGHSHDPWFWFGSIGRTVDAVASAHVEIFQPIAISTSLVVAGLVLLILVLIRAVGLTVALPPVVLMVLGVTTSIVVTLASVIGEYWVFVRQSVGGMAIVTLGWVWLMAAAWNAPAVRTRIRGLVGVVVVLLVTTGAVRVSEQLAQPFHEAAVSRV
jgi:hypothetical protein